MSVNWIITLFILNPVTDFWKDGYLATGEGTTEKISEFQVEIKLNRSRADTLIIKLQELQPLSFKNLSDKKYSWSINYCEYPCPFAGIF